MEDTLWAVVLLRRSCKTRGELSVSQCEREGKDGRHMASQNFRYGILGIERSPKLLTIPSITLFVGYV